MAGPPRTVPPPASTASRTGGAFSRPEARGHTRDAMIADEIRFGQASEAQLALAAEVCYRVYKDSPLRRAFLSPDMVLRRWRWVIEGNPTGSPFGVPAWVATRGDYVVGHFGLIPATAVVDGRAVPVAWGRDFFVAPSAQGAGVGPRLVGAALAAV